MRFLASLFALLLGLSTANADYYIRDAQSGSVIGVKSTFIGGVHVPQSIPTGPTGAAYTFASPHPVGLSIGGAAVAVGNPIFAQLTAGSANIGVVTLGTGSNVVGGVTQSGSWSFTCTSGCAAAVNASSDALSGTSLAASGSVLYNGSTWDRRRAAPGTVGVASVNTEGTKATYSQCATVSVSSGTGGDLATLQGSASKTVRVTRFYIDGFTTSFQTNSLSLFRRSSADTVGTTGSPAALAKHDTASAAATAVFTSYTVPPTGGTLAGIIDSQYFSTGASTGINALGHARDFTARNEQGIVLRGTSDWLTVNLGNGSAAAGNSYNVCFTWSEE